MPSFFKDSPRFLSFLVVLLGGGTFLYAEKGDDNAEVPLEQALQKIDELHPLPQWDLEMKADAVCMLLPLTEAEPDYDLLRKLQLKDRLKEAEERVAAMEFSRGPTNLAEYFSYPETMFVRDPEHLLTTKEQQEMQDIMITHAGESPYNLHVNFLTKLDVDQVAQFKEEDHKKVIRGDHTGIVMYYFYDDPSRTVTYFSEDAQGVMPANLRAEMLESAMTVATNQLDSYQAAYRYVLDFTLNLSNFHDAPREQESALEDSPVVPAVEDAVRVPLTQKVGEYFSTIGRVPLALMLSVPVLIGLVCGLMYWKRRVQVHRYPVTDLPPQLGFPRGRGCSGVVQFGKDAPPLKQQEKKIFG